jgi:hypothetical protein
MSGSKQARHPPSKRTGVLRLNDNQMNVSGLFTSRPHARWKYLIVLVWYIFCVVAIAS